MKELPLGSSRVRVKGSSVPSAITCSLARTAATWSCTSGATSFLYSCSCGGKEKELWWEHTSSELEWCIDVVGRLCVYVCVCVCVCDWLQKQKHEWIHHHGVARARGRMREREGRGVQGVASHLLQPLDGGLQHALHSGQHPRLRPRGDLKLQLRHTHARLVALDQLTIQVLWVQQQAAVAAAQQ